MKAAALTGELQRVVSTAFRTIMLFQDLYREEPFLESLDDFDRLPTTSRNDYAQLHDVSDMVSNLGDMSSPIAAWHCNASEFPLTVLHSDNDEGAVEERIKYVLSESGIADAQRITLVVGSRQVYAASDLAETLIYMNHPCEMLLLDGEPPSAICERLSRTDATSVFRLCDREIGAEALPSCVRRLITFNGGGGQNGTIKHADVLHLDEIPFVAVDTGDGRYTALQGQFFFEQSGDGTLMITTLQHDYVPFIRYDTGIRAAVSGNSFHLEK